jgi:hypothetical protein
MAAGLTKCSRCGKLFAGAEGRDMCMTCASRTVDRSELVREAVDHWGLTEAEEVALFAGLPVREAISLMRSLGVESDSTRENPPCKRCNRQPSSDDSYFCMNCRIELNQALGHAADEMVTRVNKAAAELIAGPKIYNKPAASYSSVTTLGEKRRRISQGEGGFTPKNRWSG